jgi:hypothetical protein
MATHATSLSSSRDNDASCFVRRPLSPPPTPCHRGGSRRVAAARRGHAPASFSTPAGGPEEEGTRCGESLGGGGRTPRRIVYLASPPVAGKRREALDLVREAAATGGARQPTASRDARRELQPPLEAGLICGGFFLSLAQMESLGCRFALLAGDSLTA